MNGRDRPLDRKQARLKIAFALILSGIAGFVDTLGFMSLSHIYAANMTGNTVSLAMAWSKQDWGRFFRRGAPLPSFFIGLVVSRLIIQSANRRRMEWGASISLALEALFLALVVVVGREHIVNGEVVDDSDFAYYVMVVLISAAMGLQNAILSDFGPLNVRTTHVTGTLAKCADELASGYYGKSGLYGTVWLSYLAGAVPGAFLLLAIGHAALWIPVTLLVVLAVLNYARPILLKKGRPGSLQPDVSPVSSR